ncbi:MAG: DUF2971 domain-containing protein [Steroidobacteraceae bacterium]
MTTTQRGYFAMLRDFIRRAISSAQRDDLARRMGFAWALGIDTLYKFKGFTGDQRDHVIDMLEHSRFYFSVPDQFNDPYDVAPVIALGGDPKDPAFLAELEAKELASLKRRGLNDAQIEAYRKASGTDISQLAAGARDDLRFKMRRDTRIFCMSAEQCHPLQWSHYADRHRGLCLHLRCAAGKPLGLARRVEYRTDREPILLPLERQSHDEIVERLILLKADFWSYEREYRIVGDVGVDWGATLNGRYLDIDRDVLTGVTIGMWMPEPDQTALLALIDKHHPALPVWKAVEDFDRFWIKVERLR